MKKDIHPDNYRLVVFEDLNNGFRILTRSTVASSETTKWSVDNKEYPLVKVHISSASHPFFTGQKTKPSKTSLKMTAACNRTLFLYINRSYN
jgi:large subunit ribosomal protein L31